MISLVPGWAAGAGCAWTADVPFPSPIVALAASSARVVVLQHRRTADLLFGKARADYNAAGVPRKIPWQVLYLSGKMAGPRLVFGHQERNKECRDEDNTS